MENKESTWCFFCHKPLLIHSNIFAESPLNFNINGNYNNDQSQVDNMEVLKFFKLVNKYFVTSGGGLTLKHIECEVENLVEKCFSCTDCCFILTSVNQLYQQLECLQMKINYKINTLHSVMDAAAIESQIGRMEELSEFRTTFMKKCSDHLTENQPKVILIRCNKKGMNCKEDIDKLAGNCSTPTEACQIDEDGHVKDQFTDYYDDNDTGSPSTHVQEEKIEHPSLSHQVTDDKGISSNDNACHGDQQLVTTTQVTDNKYPGWSASILATSDVTHEPETELSSARCLRKRFECVECKQTFTQLAQLEIHVKSHDQDYCMEHEEEKVESGTEESSESSHDEQVLEEDLGSATENDSSGMELDDSKVVPGNSQQMEETDESKNKKKKVQRKVATMVKCGNDNKCIMKCTLCPAILPNQHEQISHIKKTHFPELGKGYSWHANWVVTKDGVTAKQWTLKTGAKFVCPVEICGKKFMTETCLNDHSKLHGDFPCKFCGQVEHFARDLALHELHEHSETAFGNDEPKFKNNKCPRCRYKMSGNYSPEKNMARYINHHLQVHLNVLVDGVRCPICKTLFLSSGRKARSNLVGHYLTFHQVPDDKSAWQVHTCPKPECEAYFHTVTQLEEHHLMFHVPGENKHVCDKCGSKFRRRKQLNTHRRGVHFKDDSWAAFKFPCKQPGCGKRWESQLDLDRHMDNGHSLSVSNELTFLCSHCGKGFRAKCYLTKHMKIHDLKLQRERELAKPVCDQCGKCFKLQWYLDVHMQSHSGPSSWKFSCEVCNKKCMSKQKLEEHMRTHSKERPFICQNCGKTYAHRHNLRIHMKNKHG